MTLFCSVQNKFVCKVINLGFFCSEIVERQFYGYNSWKNTYAVRIFKFFLKEIEVSKEVRFLVLFPFRDLSRSWIKFYEDCDSILLNLRNFIKLEVFGCKRIFS
jgi:hypothetical protein